MTRENGRQNRQICPKRHARSQTDQSKSDHIARPQSEGEGEGQNRQGHARQQYRLGPEARGGPCPKWRGQGGSEEEQQQKRPLPSKGLQHPFNVEKKKGG